MKYSRTALGLLNAQYRSVLRKCFLINAGLFALGAIATATPANADETNKYDMVDGASVVLTENESITNTIDLGSNRYSAIRVGGNNSINTGDYTLTVNSSGATGRNVIVENTANASNFEFTGNLVGSAISTGNADARALRNGGIGAVSSYNGNIKINTSAAGKDSLGIQVYNGSDNYFSGSLTDISSVGTSSSGGYTRAIQVYDASGAKVTLSADSTKLSAEGGNVAEGIFAHRGKVYVNGDTEITAKNGYDNTRGIGVQSDSTSTDATYNAGVYLNGDNITVSSSSDSTKDKTSSLGLFASGYYSTIESNSSNLVITAKSETGSARGINSQYGANVSLNAGTSTEINAEAATDARGVISMMGWGYPGHFTSHGNLTADATGGDSAYGVMVYNESSFVADQLNATGTATGENGEGIGAVVVDSTDVVIGSEGKTSSLKGTAENGYGYGLDVEASSGNTASATLKGTMTVDGSSAGVYIEGTDATLTNEATLTVKNGIYNKGTFTNSGTLNIESVVDTERNGSAIYNDGTMSLGDGINLSGNTAQSGGAIYNAVNGAITIGNNAVFNDNSAEYNEGVNPYGGSDIKNYGSITIGDNAQFTRSEYVDAINDDKYDTGIYTMKGSTTTIGNNAYFKNIAQVLNNEDGTTQTIGDYATFEHNGSVVTNFGGTYTIGDNATFKDSQFMTLANKGTGSSITVGKNATFDSNQNPVFHLSGGDWKYMNGDGAVANNNSTNSTMTFGDGFVAKNNASAGKGIVYNVASSTINFNGSAEFNDNTAENGVIYNAGTVNLKGSTTFSGNQNNADEKVSDIYNTGTLNVTAANGSVLDFALDGGIDGTGVVNVNGAGTVNLTGNVNNQTVNVTSGELALSEGAADGSNLSGSTVNVNSGATINTIDEVANNYSGKITLNNGASISLDADLNVDNKYDTYSAADGATINITKINLLSALSGSSVADRTFQIADKGTFDVSSVADSIKVYTSEAKYTLQSGAANSGEIKLVGDTSGSHGLDIAVNDTNANNRQDVIYEVTTTENFDSGDKTIKNAEFLIEGNGQTIAAGTGVNSIIVNTDSSLTMNNAVLESFNGPAIQNAGEAYLDSVTIAASNAGAFKNTGYMEVKDSNVLANVDNRGILVSDPSTYSGTVTNAAGATASFDADTFTGTATLDNEGLVQLSNGVTFDAGADITGEGDIALLSGITHFNNTSNTNDITLAAGADFDGTLDGGSLDTQNGVIDTVSGSVSGVELAIDANLSGTGTADKFAGADSATKITSINILGNNYGTNESLTIAAGLTGATLDDNVQINGANYYTDVSVDASGNLVLSDKLVNTSTIRGKLDSSSNPTGDVVIGDRAATTTLGTTKAQVALDNAAETATVTAANGLIISDGATTPKTSTLSATADGLNISGGAKVNGDLKVGSAGTYGITGAGVATLGATTVNSLAVSGSTPTISSIQTSVRATGTATDTALATEKAVRDQLELKQNKLTAGDGITITAATDTIAVNLDTVAETTDKKVMTAAERTKLAGIAAGAQVNVIEGVQVNGADLTPDANKKVNVTVAEGTTNGTIKVNGTDVAVHGLDTAAYAKTTDFDAAGTAAAAVAALDASASQTAGADGLALSITEVDGKITTISGSIAANTYDAYGAASAAQTAANTYTDTQLANYSTTTQMNSAINTAKSDAISTAAADATTKANAAKAYTDTQLTNYSTTTQMNSAINTAKSDAISTAATDATTKANAAQTAANTYTDTSIAALDANASQAAGTDGLALSITEENGKITAITGSIAANTYDAYGAASTAKTEAITTAEGYTDTSIAGLDANASQAAGTDGLALSITEENGKITAITGSIAANTYDAYGAASTAESNANTYTDNAIAGLDASASQTAGADGLSLNITEVDGKITAISGSIAANTYDAYGSAAAVQGSTTETVESVNVKVNNARYVADDASAKADNARYVADTASSKADNAMYVANEATTKANTALDNAAQAQTAANNAQSAADAAQTSANNAQYTADVAQSAANNARYVADTASSKADNAMYVANEATTKADTALDNAAQAQTAANNAQSAADAAQGTANTALANAATAQGRADHAYALAEKVEGEAAQAQTTANQAKDRADHAYALAEKVEGEAAQAQTTANQAKDRADHAYALAEMADDKADAAQQAANHAQSTADAAVAQNTVQDTGLSNIMGVIGGTYATDTGAVTPDAIDVTGYTGSTIIGAVNQLDDNFTNSTIDAKFKSLATTGDASIGGDLTVGTKFKVTAADGSFSASNDKFVVNADGAVTASNGKFVVDADGAIKASNNKFIVNTDGAVTASNGKFVVNDNGAITASNGKFIVDENGAVTADGKVVANGFENANGSFLVDGSGNTAVGGNFRVSDKFTVDSSTGNTVVGGTLTAGAGKFTVDTSGNTIAAGKATAAEFANGSATFAVSTTGDINATSITTTGDANVGGKLNVTSDTAIGGTLSAAGGKFTVDGSGNTAIYGNTQLGGNLAVTDKFTVEGATGNTNVGGKLNVAGDVAINGNTQLGGNFAVTDKFTVDGATGDTISGGKLTAAEFANGSATFAVSTTGDINATSITTTGDANIGGDLNVTGDTTLADTTVNGDLTVTGLSHLDGGVNVNNKFTVGTDGAVSAAGGSFTIAADGKTIVGNDFAVTDKFTVEGATGNTVVGGTFAVQDKFTVDTTGNMIAAGKATAKEFANGSATFTVSDDGNVVAQNITAQGDLGVLGTAWLTNAQVSHDLAVANDATVGNDFAVAGTSNLHDTNVNGALATTGSATIGGDLGVAGSTWLKNTHVNGDLDVSGTTKTTALTFDGNSYVAAMDQGAAAITNGVVDDQAKRTMATNATVAKTVGNLAALDNTHGVTSVADVASAIDSLAANVETATGGTFTGATWKATVDMSTPVVDYTYNGATGHNNIMSFVSDLAYNIGSATTAANGNIASANSVNANLDMLDASIGDRSNIGSKNAAINAGTAANVAAGMRAVGDAIGDMNFASSHYVGGTNDLSSAVRTLDDNLYRVETDMHDLRRDFNRGMASMAAMSALVPNPRAYGNTSLAIGTGAYSGHTAAAIGGFHYLTDNIMLNAGAAWGNSSDASYRMGVTFSW